MDIINKNTPSIKILFLADTHLGFDLPFNPRITRRRRGHDFFANFNKALEPALNKTVDLVVHGGDLLYRSKVPPRLVDMAFEPLKQVAEAGVPVYLVPGNHERSAIPYRLLAAHPGIHIFHKPQTYTLDINGFTIALVGFPYVRDNVRGTFSRVLEETAFQSQKADAYLLCMHHCVEGSAVCTGQSLYVFRNQDFVVRSADIPPLFTAVLSGHIHRFQVLTKDTERHPNGRLLPVPVFYPGSVERTSFAEKGETKGYLVLEIGTENTTKGKLKNWTFHELPARPMIELRPDFGNIPAPQAAAHLKTMLDRLPPDSVVKLTIKGKMDETTAALLSAASLRRLAPPTMNISLAITPP